jgi:hypothetical protein
VLAIVCPTTATVKSEFSISNGTKSAYESDRVLLGRDFALQVGQGPEKELYALVYSLDKFKPYLFGPQFTWITDAKCLTWLNRVKDTSPKFLRWCLQVQGVDFTVQHKPGKDSVVPDALSRVILEFASKYTRRTTTSEHPIAALTPVLELVVEPQAPYDSKDDVAVSYGSLANLDDVHHGAASDRRASIDHVASITPTEFPDRDGIATAPSKLTRNEYALSGGLLVRLPNGSAPGVGRAAYAFRSL